MLFIQAKHYTSITGGTRKIIWLVMHAMQAPEKPTTAEGVANFFAAGTRIASAHYCSDDDSTVQSVKDNDVAYGAAGANAKGLHFEQAGYSEQSAMEWADAYSSRMLREQVGPLVGAKARQYGIPLEFRNYIDLRDFLPGVTTHAEVQKAWPSTGHWDPGPHYPMASMLSIARGLPRPGPSPNLPPRSYPVWPGRYLRLGMHGSDVRTWQAQMRLRGWSLVVDGVFGLQTDHAVRAFQKEKHLGVDGIIGPNTWNAAWHEPIT